jgi:Bacteriophage lambda head decoration protein D
MDHTLAAIRTRSLRALYPPPRSPVRWRILDYGAISDNLNQEGSNDMSILDERRNPQDFILSQEAGNLSRDTAHLVDPSVVIPGQVLQFVAATTDVPAHWLPLNAEAPFAAAGIAMYEAATTSGHDVDTAVISRKAEVCGARLTWPEGINETGKAIAIEALAAVGIVVR